MTPAGTKTVRFDILYSQDDNIMSAAGFTKACRLIMHTQAGGMCWVAVVCSSWVWISRSGSGRSSQRAEGDLNIPRIRSANKMAMHSVLLMMLAWRRGPTIFLEQPLSSVLGSFTPMKELLDWTMRESVTTSLGAYNAESEKLIKVWSTSQYVADLKRKRTSTGTTLATCVAGKVTGKSKELNNSSAYPLLFGQEVARIMRRIMAAPATENMYEDDLADDLASRLCKRKRVDR